MEDVMVRDEQTPDVKYQVAKVTFDSFPEYKAKCLLIAEHIRNTEVTEDNLPEVKKELAAARKITDELNSRKVQIKKIILSDYTIFEGEVKELKGIIDEADGELRGKVNALEEQARDRKKEEIRQVFLKRIGQYQIGTLIPDAFDRWWHEDLANKSKSMKAVEADMVDWLEGTEKDITTLKGMDKEILVEYLDTMDLAAAIQTVNARNARRQAVEDAPDDIVPEEQVAVFRVYGAKDITLAEMLLKNNNITYRKD
jgi:hypothetical protein